MQYDSIFKVYYKKRFTLYAIQPKISKTRVKGCQKNAFQNNEDANTSKQWCYATFL